MYFVLFTFGVFCIVYVQDIDVFCFDYILYRCSFIGVFCILYVYVGCLHVRCMYSFCLGFMQDMCSLWDIDVFCCVYVFCFVYVCRKTMYFVLFTFVGYRCILLCLRSCRIWMYFVVFTFMQDMMYFVVFTFMQDIDVFCCVYVHVGY